MTHPLPILTDRTEFGFRRVSCGCAKCSRFCIGLPGFLIPADLDRIVNRMGAEKAGRWMETNLRASPGAVAVQNGRPFRIPTLVPAMDKHGRCRQLRPDGTCGIHEDSPFGCSFFDDHMSDAQHAIRRDAGYRAVMMAYQTGHVYGDILKTLADAGLTVEPPEVRRVVTG